MAKTTTSADRLLTLFRENARRVHARGLSHMRITDDVIEPGRIHLDGHSVANFGDCSYLGLGTDLRLADGAKRAIDRFGTSYSSSIAYTAVPLYTELKERFETLMGASVALAPTTTLAHAAALPVLVRGGDIVLMDSAVHNSVQMSTQLLAASGIDVRSVLHGDISTLETMIEQAAADTEGAVWYLADGVYSMSGAAAPFEHLVELLDIYDRLRIYVDDAHGFSWRGRHGSGLALDRMGWQDRLFISAGLAKGFGSAGGIIASRDSDAIELIEVCGPPLTFGGPLTPATLGASIVSADIHLSAEIDERQAALAERIQQVVARGAELQLPLVAQDDTPIFFVEIGRTDMMIDIGEAMVTDGFYLNPAAWPAVPHRHAGLRFTVTNHLPLPTIDTMLERLAAHLSSAGVLDRLVIDLRGQDPVIDTP